MSAASPCFLSSQNPKRESSLRPESFIFAARLLAESSKGRPSQVTLRRAVSTAYYALFHTLARNNADMLVGSGKPTRSKHAWGEAYRALQHGNAKKACEDRTLVTRFPPEVAAFAAAFAALQSKRHAADYDPYAVFQKSTVLNDIDWAERVIQAFAGASPKDRTAFASWVLFRQAKRN